MSAQAALDSCKVFNIHHRTREHSPWKYVNGTVLDESTASQWKGVRFLYLELAKSPLHAINFGRNSSDPVQPVDSDPAQPDEGQTQVLPGAVVRKIVDMLSNPVDHPDELFADDVARSSAEAFAVETVMQAQLAGMLLSIVLTLSLSVDSNLKRQLHDAGAGQLLCKLALGKTAHSHPEDAQAQLVKDSRPEVYGKIQELYKLIPLAIACICEATSTWDDFMQHFDESVSRLSMVRERLNTGLAARLRDQLTLLRSGIAPSSTVAVQHASCQDMANWVTAAHKQYLRELQLAYRSAISGYNREQTGNCLYWLFPEPPTAAAAFGGEKQVKGVDATKSKAKKHGSSKATWPPLSVALLATVTFLAGLVVGECSSEKHADLA